MQNAGGRSTMDRVGNVDGVDAPEVSLDDAGSGWDPYAVWRERVHGARAQAKAAPAASTTRAATAASTAASCDPLETWQGRVQRARANRR